MTGTLSFSQGIEVSDNEDLDSSTSGVTTTSRTGLGFGVESVTRIETLRFSIGTEIVGDFGGGADDDFSIENTTAALEYGRVGANSALRFSARYAEVNLEDEVLLADPEFGIGLGPDTIIVDSGSVNTTSLGLTFETGTSAPFGVEVTARYIDRDYIDTTDPDLSDVTRVSVDALARFRINPALTARALAGIAREDEDDAASTETRDTYVGLGIGGETAGGLSFTGDLLFDRSETTVAGPTTTTDEGVGVEVSVTQDRPDGSIGADVSSRIGDDGRRTEASVNRNFDMRNGEFGFSLGVVDQDGDDTLRPAASVLYRQETPRGGLTASLTQEPSIDSGDAYVNTSIEIDYEEAINEVSGWAAGVAYTASNQVGGGDDDSRATATIAYSRALTEEWRMRTGLEHIRESDSGASTESSNTLFFNIERDITFGF